MMSARNANLVIEEQLDQRLAAIGHEFGDVDTVFFSGPLIDTVDDEIRAAIERPVAAGATRPNKIMFVLTTDGGYIHIVHRIVDTLRHYYQFVEFIIPNQAYSAGTILAI